MKSKFSQDFKDELKSLTFDEQRTAIGIFLKSSSGGKLWDLITGLRGPDSPSERADMKYNEHSTAYGARCARKYKSTQIIREYAFFGVIGGAAKHRPGTKIVLPPQERFDHFDKHMLRAAEAIGLGVQYETED